MEQLINMGKDFLKQMAKKIGKILLKNPYTYIVLGIIFVIIVIIGCMADVNASGSTNSGGMSQFSSQSSLSNEDRGPIVDEKIWKAIKELGYSDISTAAAMGNLHYESDGFVRDKLGNNEENEDKIAYTSIGIGQWTNKKGTDKGRNTNLRKYAESKGKKWRNEDVQIEFLVAELNGGGLGGLATNPFVDATHNGTTYKYSEWKDATDTAKLDKAKLNKITEIFCYTFKSNDPSTANIEQRQKLALAYYNTYAGDNYDTESDDDVSENTRTEDTAPENIEATPGENTETPNTGTVGESKEEILNSSNGLIAKFTSGITGKTFYIFNQNKDVAEFGLNPSNCCNILVAASIASGYDSEAIESNYSTERNNWKHMLEKAYEYEGDYVLSDEGNTNNYFANYGLTATTTKSSSPYSIENVRKLITSGQYIAIRFKQGVASFGKSGDRYSKTDGHWVGIIGYREKNGKEEIYIVDNGYSHATGWKSIDEFETCKGNIQWFTIIK